MKRTQMRRQSPKGRARARTLGEIRQDILRRADGRCEHPLCRKRVPVDLHHVVKRSQTAPAAADTVDNLVALCRPHHDMTDRPIQRTGTWMKWIEDLSHEYWGYGALTRELTIVAGRFETFWFCQVIPRDDLPTVWTGTYERPLDPTSPARPFREREILTAAALNQAIRYGFLA